MKDIYSEIRNIQQQFFELLDNHFKTERSELEPLLSAYDKNDHLIYTNIDEKAYEIGRKSPIVSFEGREIPGLTYKAILLVRDIHSFWAKHHKTLYEAIIQIPYTKLHSKSSFQTLINEVRSTALYVDTVVADDWIFSLREATEDHKRPLSGDLGVNILKEYIFLWSFRKLILADIVPPILIICPSPHYADPDLRKVSNKLSLWLALRYANVLYGQTFNSINDLIDYTQNFTNISDLTKQIAKPNLIWEEGDTLESKIERKLYIASNSFQISGSSDEIIDINPGMAIIIHEMSGFDVIAQQKIDNEILDLEPRVPRYHWDEFLWSLNQRTELTKDHDKISEETAVVRILENKEMSWLGNIPLEKLIELRSEGRMEEMRTLIRESNERLKFADFSKVSELAQEVKANLEDALMKHESDLKSQEMMSRLKIQTSVTELLVSGWIALVTTKVPELSIPGSIFGLAVGGSSVWDVIAKVNGFKIKAAEESRRPIGILWDAFSKGK